MLVVSSFLVLGTASRRPRSFARADQLPVEPGQGLDLAVELLPLAALLPAGHQLRVALGGHDAACFDRYGPSGETFTVHLGDHSTLDLPILAAGNVSRTSPRTDSSRLGISRR